ncbi:hypothetical protein V8F06_009877 [Rhypophila decipiens]
MANLEGLPPELLIPILSCCQSPKDLHSLISVSPACFRVLSAHRKYIFPSVLRNALGPANYRELLAIFHVPSPVAAEGDADNGTSDEGNNKVTKHRNHVMVSFLEHYFSTQPFEDRRDLTVMAAMCRLYNTIVHLTDQYFLHDSQNLMVAHSGESRSTTTTLATPLSAAEKTRLHRAFLRHHLYSRVSSYDESKPIGGPGQFHRWIPPMPRTLREVEEFSSIHYSLLERTLLGYNIRLVREQRALLHHDIMLAREQRAGANSDSVIP